MLIAAMFVLGAVSWPSAPDQVPVHWGFSGQPDRYGGKFEGLLLLPATMLFIYLLMLLLPYVDPRRANYARFRGAYLVMRVATLVFLALIYGFVLLWIGGIRVEPSVILALVGGLLVVLGIPMHKVRPNWFVGIRTPWTLFSELSWRKTHRLGGWFLALTGLAFMISGLVGSPTAFRVALIFLVAGILFLFVYSYFVWRADPEKSSRRNSYL
jgi:uncharacterized membrane protein